MKEHFGELGGLIGSATKRTVRDINSFLQITDINYELESKVLDETFTRAVLRYKSRSGAAVPVENIKLNLSWGKRNAFALVLFMHYALSQEPGLVILDDPISSFDANKKFAIISRLFENTRSRKTVYRSTVLLLTHDLQPVIDFVVAGKPHNHYTVATYLRNNSGVISGVPIAADDVRPVPVILSE